MLLVGEGGTSDMSAPERVTGRWRRRLWQCCPSHSIRRGTLAASTDALRSSVLSSGLTSTHLESRMA